MSLKLLTNSHSPEFKNLKSQLAKINIKNNDLVQISAYRKKLLNNKTVIEYKELGAGTRKHNKIKKISSIARYAVTSKRNGKLLYKLAKHYRPEVIIELGTSLGISTLHLAFASANVPIITIDGNKEVQSIAREEIKLLGFENITFITSTFEEVFENILKGTENEKVLVFIDGNHTYEATLKYFELCTKYLHGNSVIIIDDINWSWGMHKVWKTIISDKWANYSIDFFSMGVIFAGKEEKQKHNYNV